MNMMSLLQTGVHFIAIMISLSIHHNCFSTGKLLNSMCCIDKINIMTLAATVTELPFLDLGNESRVHGDGKLFGSGYLYDLRPLDETEMPTSCLPFPFSNIKLETNMKILVSFDFRFDLHVQDISHTF